MDSFTIGNSEAAKILCRILDSKEKSIRKKY